MERLNRKPKDEEGAATRFSSEDLFLRIRMANTSFDNLSSDGEISEESNILENAFLEVGKRCSTYRKDERQVRKNLAKTAFAIGAFTVFSIGAITNNEALTNYGATLSFLGLFSLSSLNVVKSPLWYTDCLNG